MNAVEVAVSRFREGHSCSQAVFTAFAEPLGLDYDTAVRLSAGFGGGMGRMGDVCGAVTGALMVLGLRFGGVEAEAKEKTYELVREFADRFKIRRESLDCRDLLGCDLSTPEGRKTAAEQSLHATICSQVVREAAEILEDILTRDL